VIDVDRARVPIAVAATPVTEVAALGANTTLSRRRRGERLDRAPSPRMRAKYMQVAQRSPARARRS
jgi:hypothetical protein